MKFLTLLIGTFCLFVVVTATGSTNVPECAVFKYPDSVSTHIRLEVGSRSVDKELALRQTSDAASEEKILANLRILQMAKAVQSAMFYAVQTDDQRYSKALHYSKALQFVVEEILNDGIPERSSIEFLFVRLYFYTYDLNLQPISPAAFDLVLAALNKKIQKNPESDWRKLITLTEAMHALSLGHESRAIKAIEAIPAKTENVADLYMRAYLAYQLAKSSYRDSDLDTAINALEVLAVDNHDLLEECNKTLLGMVGYFLADMHLIQGQQLANKKHVTQTEIKIKLFKAASQIEKSRMLLDVVRVPGLWANAYDKSADIYGAIMDYSTGSTAKQYQILQDRSLLIANLY